MAVKAGDAYVELTTKGSGKFNKAMDKAGKKTETLGGKLQKLGKIMLAVYAGNVISQGIGSLIKSSSDLEETISKFGVVFGNVGDEAEAISQRLVNSFGLSSREAKDLLANTGDLLTGFGFTQDKALELSQAVNELAVDVASFKNVEGGATEASSAITKALLGEREALKGLGIAILEVDVKQRMAEDSANGLTFASERQAKASATLALIQERASNAVGDFARTQDSLANRTRVLQARWEDFKTVLGGALRDGLAVNKQMSGLQSIIQGLSSLVSALQPLFKLLGGILQLAGFVLNVFGKLISVVAKLAKIILQPLNGLKKLGKFLKGKGGKTSPEASGLAEEGDTGKSPAGAVDATKDKRSVAFVGFEDAIKRAQEQAKDRTTGDRLQERQAKASEKANEYLRELVTATNKLLPGVEIA